MVMAWTGEGAVGGSEVDRPEKFWGKRVIDVDWIQE